MSINSQNDATSAQLGPLQKIIKQNIQSTFGPQGSVSQSSLKFCGQADSTRFGRVQFGMERSPHAGCCVKRFMGESHGCCPGIQSGKPFEHEYIKAVERDIKNKGEMPDLKPEVVAKLKSMQAEGEKQTEYERLENIAKTHAVKKPQPIAKDDLSASDRRLLMFKNKIVKIVTAPFRLIKWLANGFREDVVDLWHKIKRLFTRLRKA